MTCDAMLFADKAIQEKNSKWGLIGIFDRFTFTEFPTQIVPHWWLFLSVRELDEGDHTFAVNLLRDNQNQVFSSINGELKVADSTRGITLVLPVQGVMFPKPDKYSMNVYIDGQFLASRDLIVEEVGSRPGG